MMTIKEVDKKESLELIPDILKNKELILHDNAVYYVLFDEDVPVSVLNVFKCKGYVKIQGAFTPAEYRGKGYFFTLLGNIVQKYRKYKRKGDCSSPSTMRMYLKLGYSLKKVRRFKHYTLWYMEKEADKD